MALRHSELYQALIAAGAPPEKAAVAAEDFATLLLDVDGFKAASRPKPPAGGPDLRTELRTLKWMLSLAIALNLAVLALILMHG
jgi:hypothetical protein